MALAAFFLAILPLGATAQAQQVSVPSTVFFNGNMGYTYNYSVTNNTSMTLAIVTVPVNPNSSLINLIAPTGFGISFDPGPGLVSFFEDNNPNTPNIFAPGSTVSGFSYTSFFAPGTVKFEALDVSANSFTGSTLAAVTPMVATVPDSTSTLLLLSLALVGGVFVRRSIATHPVSIR